MSFLRAFALLAAAIAVFCHGVASAKTESDGEDVKRELSNPYYYPPKINPGIELQTNVLPGKRYKEDCDEAKNTLSVNFNDFITYCYEIKNTGDSPLIDIKLVDPVTGFTADIYKLGPHQSKVFIYVDQVKGGRANRSTASGQPAFPDGSKAPFDRIESQDGALTRLIKPEGRIEVEAAVTKGTPYHADCDDARDPFIGYKGDEITYCIKITNTGDAWLADGLLELSGVGASRSFGPLKPGEMLWVKIGDWLSYPATNVATVIAKPSFDGTKLIGGKRPVSDSDAATVKIYYY